MMSLCASPTKKVFTDKKRVPSFIKTRRNDWSHEIPKNQINTTLQFTNGDRFIPMRFKPEHIELNAKFIDNNEEKDILNANLTKASSYWRQNSFVTEMNNTFGIRNAHLLKFNQMQPHLANLSRLNNLDGDWPCKPRPRPMAFPKATHDMPELSCTSFDLNLMDWSITDQMAVSFGQDIIVWHNWDETTMVFSVKNPAALKYSKDGKYLAIGCMDHGFPVLELWKRAHSKEFIVSDGKYFQKSVGSVCCIEWSNDSKNIVCGMGNGILMVLGMPTVCRLRKIQKHSHEITCICFSPNGRYMASGDIKGNIFIFNTMRCYFVMFRLHAKAGNITLDWHPWTGVDLAISESCPPSISIFSMPRAEIAAFYQRLDTKIVINKITFNKITGELLVNISKRDDTGLLCSEMLVLSSLNRVVDILGNHERGSIFMMWSPDGTKLATAGLDESFSVWEFCSEDRLKNNFKKQQKSKSNQERSPLDLYRLFK